MANAVADHETHTATVTFDDEKTSVEQMKEALDTDNYSVKGEPKYLR